MHLPWTLARGVDRRPDSGTPGPDLLTQPLPLQRPASREGHSPASSSAPTERGPGWGSVTPHTDRTPVSIAHLSASQGGGLCRPESCPHPPPARGSPPGRGLSRSHGHISLCPARPSPRPSIQQRPGLLCSGQPGTPGGGGGMVGHALYPKRVNMHTPRQRGFPCEFPAGQAVCDLA